jgi:hypothetical protein
MHVQRAFSTRSKTENEVRRTRAAGLLGRSQVEFQPCGPSIQLPERCANTLLDFVAPKTGSLRIPGIEMVRAPLSTLGSLNCFDTCRRHCRERFFARVKRQNRGTAHANNACRCRIWRYREAASSRLLLVSAVDRLAPVRSSKRAR